jgi:tryptophan synthase alpha chain
VPKAFGTKAFGTKAFGMKRLFPEMKESGFSGLIVPDLPIEEAGPWSEEAERNAVSLIFLATPVSQKKRLRLIASRTRGFVYCVSLTGITGVRDEVPQGLPEFLARVRSVTKKPLAVGFGISTPDQVRRIAPVADGVIVGSRLVEAVRKGEDVQALVRNLKKATRRQHTMTID